MFFPIGYCKSLFYNLLGKLIVMIIKMEIAFDQSFLFKNAIRKDRSTTYLLDSSKEVVDTHVSYVSLITVMLKGLHSFTELSFLPSL